MKRVWLTISVIGLLLGGSFLAAEPAWAIDVPCQCFCAAPDGAQDIGELTTLTCEKECSSRFQGFVACAADASQYPSQNPRCFTQDQCTEMQSVLAEKCRTEGESGCEKIATTWGGEQPKICLPGSHYCYQSTVADIKLGIEILGAKSVQDVTGYIDLIYRYLLTIAGTLAIVMIMIGGVQYVMSAGSGKIEEAKERMKNAVIGLVILLGAFAILFTVNPVLVNLQVPKLPMLKGIEYLGGTTCEDLQPFVDKGWLKITGATSGKNGQYYCGSVAKVEKVEDAEQLVAGVPDTCEYRGCHTTQTTCVGHADQAICTKCEEVGSSGDRGIKPSGLVCSLLERSDKDYTVTAPDGQIIKKHYCWFTHDVTVAQNPVTGSCVSMNLDCYQINTCSDYDDIDLDASYESPAATGGSAELEDVALGSGGELAEPVSLNAICEQDPCRWNRKDNAKDCYFDDSLQSNDCKTRP